MESIGTRLHEARQERKLSIAKVSQDTKIHSHILNALEEDKFKKILNPTYVKAFLKEYSQYLGLDSEALVKEYLSMSPEKPEQVLTFKAKERKSFNYVARYLLPIVMILTFVVVVFLSYLATSRIKGLIEARKDTSEPQTIFKIERPTPEVKPVPRREMAKKIPPEKPVPRMTRDGEKPAVEPLSLTVYAKRKVWIQTKADGEIIFQDILSPEAKVTWQADKEIVLWVGDGDAFTLNLNGRDLGTPGGGVIKDITITREGMRIPSKGIR